MKSKVQAGMTGQTEEQFFCLPVSAFFGGTFSYICQEGLLQGMTIQTGRKLLTSSLQCWHINVEAMEGRSDEC